jgi:hypothetical protein
MNEEPAFERLVHVVAHPHFADDVWVRVDSRGVWISIVTDEYEGNAQMTLIAAKLLLPVLTEAIAVAEKIRLDWPLG